MPIPITLLRSYLSETQPEGIEMIMLMKLLTLLREPRVTASAPSSVVYIEV